MRYNTLIPMTLILAAHLLPAHAASAAVSEPDATEIKSTKELTGALSKIEPSLEKSIEKMAQEDKIRVVIKFKTGIFSRLPGAQGLSDADRATLITDSRNAMFGEDALASMSSERKVEGVKRALKYLPYVAFEGTRDEINAFAQNGRVESIYPDRKAELFVLPESTGTALTDAVTARAQGFTGAGQTVAILDTGVARNHTFIGASRVVAEACYAVDCQASSGPGSSATPAGGDFHGTHVTGIAAGSDTLTFSGVAPEANIIGVRVFPAFDTGNFIDVAAGLEFVYEQRNNFDIAAANMSLGTRGQSFSLPCDGADAPFDEVVTDAINLVDGAGIAVVVSSGNDSVTDGISFPACVSNAISVGATNDGSSDNPICAPLGPDTSGFDEVSSYSNSSALVDILAPGSNIRSSWGTNSEICNLRGTSMAAPHVAGAFAVLKAVAPSASNDLILSTLQDTGRPITDPRNNITRSRIDVYEAALALDTSGPPPSTASVVPVLLLLLGV